MTLAHPPALVPGRELCWAPAWPCSDARIVFDRVSGDYWVLNEAASAALQSLQAGHMADSQLTPDLAQDLVKAGLLSAPA